MHRFGLLMLAKRRSPSYNIVSNPKNSCETTALGFLPEVKREQTKAGQLMNSLENCFFVGKSSSDTSRVNLPFVYEAVVGFLSVLMVFELIVFL